MTPVNENIFHGQIGAKNAGQNVVIIDVFRAVPTAIAILEQKPSIYYMTSDENNVRSSKPDFIRIGKPFMGSNVNYDAPNSPTRVSEIELFGQSVIHRTAGCGGCLDGLFDPKIVLLCSISNLKATKLFMDKMGGKWDIVAAGHQGITQVKEDNVCAKALVSEDPIGYTETYVHELRNTQSSTRFSVNSDEYPLTDIDICLNTEQVSTVILAKKEGGLWKLDVHN
jgi:phosphosulfolactate phosphohydrolase-like enzyme